MALVEVDGCVYDAEQLNLSHGYESLDAVGREAFVNHRHLTGEGREAAAEQLIRSWAAELRARWADCEFRIYRQTEVDEVTVRFHMVRPELPNWCEDGIEVVIVSSQTSSQERAKGTRQ